MNTSVMAALGKTGRFRLRLAWRIHSEVSANAVPDRLPSITVRDSQRCCAAGMLTMKIPRKPVATASQPCKDSGIPNMSVPKTAACTASVFARLVPTVKFRKLNTLTSRKVAMI